MADALVKRMDSARMERMLENALNTNEADFLSSASEITIEQVRRLRREIPMHDIARLLIFDFQLATK